jgi:4-hydroxy-tetrahydrodipicolinate reductase
MRVVQVGLGPLGRRVAADLVARGLGEVAAAIDPGAGIVGRAVGELVPGAGDAPVRASVEELGGERFDAAIVTTSSDLELVMPTLRTLLDRGMNVVSTCEELAWPWLRHPVLAQELDERAIRAGGRVLGTGVNPGFLMDAFVVAASTVCGRVRGVRVTRVQDASARRVPFQRKIGATLDAAEFAARQADGSLRHVGLGESLHLVAHYLGLGVERWEEELAMVRAKRDLECALGPIPAGRAAGVRQVARGWRGDALVIELVFQAAIAQADPHDRVEIDGDPPVDLVWKGGVHGDVATSAITLNSVRALRSLEPGLHTMASIPLQGCAPGRRPRG